MDTAIGYLELVREDLLEAAGTSTVSGRRRPGWTRFPRRLAIAGAAVVTLVAAGSVGWWVTSDSLESRPASDAAGSTGADGSTGAAGRRAVGSDDIEQTTRYETRSGSL